MGGSALAHAYGQVGDDVPDVEDPLQLAAAFKCLQGLIAEKKIAAGHDRSDGGLITTLLEMCIAGDYGMEVVVAAVRNPKPEP